MLVTRFFAARDTSVALLNNEIIDDDIITVCYNTDECQRFTASNSSGTVTWTYMVGSLTSGSLSATNPTQTSGISPPSGDGYFIGFSGGAVVSNQQLWFDKEEEASATGWGDQMVLDTARWISATEESDFMSAMDFWAFCDKADDANGASAFVDTSVTLTSVDRVAADGASALLVSISAIALAAITF